jgi:hypothetical protein
MIDTFMPGGHGGKVAKRFKAV